MYLNEDSNWNDIGIIVVNQEEADSVNDILDILVLLVHIDLLLIMIWYQLKKLILRRLMKHGILLRLIVKDLMIMAF